MGNWHTKQNKKMCWWITDQCNEGCIYCFRALNNINKFDTKQHMFILDRIIGYGTEQITWSGGEALLVPHVTQLMKYAKEHGIYNKLTTNGKLLTPEKIEEIKPYIDLVALSIDSFNDNTNQSIGRGKEHRKTVINRIKHLIDSNILVDINTVVVRQNINDLVDMAEFLKENPINGKWKLMTFFPIRDRALENKDKLEIDDKIFIETVNTLKKDYPSINIVSMMNDQIQQQYPGVRANGDLLVTRNFHDIILGNMTEKEIPKNPFDID